MLYFLLTVIFFALLLLYFRIADYYNIVDKPNERSSHNELTIRGGGVIYLVSALSVGLLHPQLWLPVLGLIIIGTISFIDDRITLSSKIRIIFHLIAVTIIFFFLGIFNLFDFWIVPILYIVVIGIINAYNFMDGINGITGSYSLLLLLGLQYVNTYVTPFIEVDLIWLPIIASSVFLFFNFRVKAKCFAGDVGSITAALWLIYLLLTLILKTNDYRYILFLAVYGVDSILTILHRLMLKQNIFDAHRLHFYQILANEQKVPHLLVTMIYVFVQLLIILLVIVSGLNSFLLFLVSILPLVLVYVICKPRLMNIRRN